MPGRADPSRLSGGRAAWEGAGLGCQRVAGREKGQQPRVLCLDEVFFAVRCILSSSASG